MVSAGPVRRTLLWAGGISPHWSKFKSATVASAASAIFVLLVMLISADHPVYGWGLFVMAPCGAGALAVIIHSVGRRVSVRDALSLSIAVAVTSSAVLAGLAIEGFVCLAMAFPLAVGMILAGALAARGVLRLWDTVTARRASGMLAVVLVVVPGSVEVEARQGRVPEVFEVSTSIDIAARPATVWRAVITPAKLPKPAHPIFRFGIAYPLASHIEGTGMGAIRYCNFSTGNLVEPVLVWDEPRILRFSVVSNPQPMQEWTLYGQIHPPHLDGFLVSKQGEFRLEPLADGRTRLIATTWYRHNLYPAAYWRWWSDYILHRVHEVVLGELALAATKQK